MDKDLIGGLAYLLSIVGVVAMIGGVIGNCSGKDEGVFIGRCEALGGIVNDNYCWSNDSTILFKKGDKPALPEGE